MMRDRVEISPPLGADTPLAERSEARGEVN